MAMRKTSRLLLTLVLAAALTTAYGSVVRGGEPEIPPSAPPPVVKTALVPSSGTSVPVGGVRQSRPASQGYGVVSGSTWLLRLQWSVQVLRQLPKRFP